MSTGVYNRTMSAIVCPSPKTEPSDVNIFISPNGLDYRASGLMFQFVSVPSATSLFPRLITNVTKTVVITGSSMNASASMCCRLEALKLVMSATVLSSSQLECKLPLSSSWGIEIGFESSISISVNCEDFVDTNLIVKKLYVPPLLRASPGFGSVQGGTVVIISGYRVGQSMGVDSLVHCLFGSLSVAADFIDVNTVACLSPMTSLALNQTSFTVPLTVSIDGGQTYLGTSRGVFTYLVDPIVTSIYPLLALEEQTFYLRFYGSNFNQISPWIVKDGSYKFNRVSSFACSVGSVTGGLYVISDTEAICVVENPRSGVFSTGISLNGQQFTFADSFPVRIMPSRDIVTSQSYALFTSTKTIRLEVSVQSEDASDDSLFDQAMVCVSTLSDPELEDGRNLKTVYPAELQRESTTGKYR